MSHMFTYGTEGLCKLGNQIKEILVDHLVGEGLMTEDAAREVKRNWAFTVKEPGMFGQLWDKWRGVKKEDGIIIEIVRACARTPVSIEEPEEEEEEQEDQQAPAAGRFDLEVP